MELMHLTESQARSYWGIDKVIRRWYIYRRLNTGNYMLVGSIKWDCNYGAIPVKEKYWKLMFFSTSDYGEKVIPVEKNPHKR
jgi:hypothetical protein